MQSNVTQGTTYQLTAGETLTDGDLAGFTGRALVMSGAAANTALLPSAATDVPVLLLTAGGATGEPIEAEGIVPGRQYIIRAGATLALGAYVECKLITNNFGKWVAFASGVKRFQLLEAAVDGQLVRALAL